MKRRILLGGITLAGGVSVALVVWIVFRPSDVGTSPPSSPARSASSAGSLQSAQSQDDKEPRTESVRSEVLEAVRAIFDTAEPPDRAAVVADAGPQTWENKPKHTLTWDERVAIGATPFGNYASRQGPRWMLVAKGLTLRGEHELAEAAMAIRSDLLKVFQPGSEPISQYELLNRQRSLLARIEPLNLQFPIPNFKVSDIQDLNDAFIDDELDGMLNKDEQE